MKNTALLVLCFFCSALSAQQFETGIIVDSIPIAKSGDETFALYLPKDYKPDELSSILFIFSPSGDGKNGVKTFVKAAEARNYILVCSNNARNGPMNLNFEIAQRLFTHIFKNFNIKEESLYLAGFSGGSRLASAIATLSGQFEGVIACGAGFSPVPSHRPSTQKYSYVGICGDRDMNYKEMIGARGYLNRLNQRNTLFTFDGGHKWPPNEQILMAFDWLEIESLKKGNLEKQDSEVLNSYLKNIEEAKIALKNNEHIIAAESYDRAVNTYSSFFNLDSVRQNLKNLKKSKVYNNALKYRKKAFEKEDVLTSIFLKRFDIDYEDSEKANFKWWEREFEKLSKQVAKGDSEMPKMIERLRFKVFVAAHMKINSDRLKPSENQVAFCKDLVSQLYPKRKKEELRNNLP
ncbi:MAG: hypothetical protein AB8B59_14960 [Maribacter sp.]